MPHRIRLFSFDSVRGRLWLLVAVIITPALLLAAVFNFQAYQNERDAVAAKLQDTARAIAGVVDGKVSECETLLKGLASTGAIGRDDLPGLYATALRALTGDERWFVLSDPSDQQLLNTRVPLGSPLPRIEGSDESRSAMRAGKLYVTDLVIGPVVKAPVVAITLPYFRDGALKYSLSVGMLPSTVAHAIDVTRYVPGSVISIVDRQGIIVARNRNPEKFVGHSATPDMVKGIATRSEAVVNSITLEGIPVLTVICPTKCGWSVLLGIPKTELYASARRLLVVQLACCALLAVVASMIAVWIGRAVVRSVDALILDAEAVGRGRMPDDNTSGLQETDFVAHALRRTAEALTRRTHTLEVLNRVNAALVGERRLEKIIPLVTDAGRELSGATFAAYLPTTTDAAGNGQPRYTLAGISPEIFEQTILPAIARREVPEKLNGAGETHAEGVKSADDNTRYLSIPVQGANGELFGRLVLGAADSAGFTTEVESVLRGLASEAAIAIDNARLSSAVQRELEAKSKAEAELRVAQQELERKVEERTASLREAIAQMEEFSYTVSHDLRSPLRTIASYAVTLEEDYGAQLDQTGKDYLRRIQRSSERMDQLTRDVLSYSRVARTEVKLAPTNVEELVRGTVEHYSELQSPATTVEIVTPMDSVLAHAPSLTQCLANLLTNAAKFVRPGERPHIIVHTKKEGPRVRIWIIDRGIGIPPDAQNRLFQIFQRGTAVGEYEGTGVGLAIVRKAAEKMGGRCGVESDGKTGSRFWIELWAA